MCGKQATAVINSGLLLVAVMGLLLPTVLHYTHTEVYFGKPELALSRFSSCIMLVTYAAYLYFQLKSQSNLYVSLNEVGYEYCDKLFSSIFFWYFSNIIIHGLIIFNLERYLYYLII